MAQLRRNILRVTGLALSGLIIAGIFYEHVGESRDRKALPQIGQSYDVGGRSLNLYCSGAGSPTGIFEGNGSEPGFRWVRLQRQVATFARACWYDRAGLGWSDPGPFPNHSDSVAHDLRNLLRAANVAPPYVLVGYQACDFIRKEGAIDPNMKGPHGILVDPMNEDMTLQIHNHNELFRPSVLFILRAVTAVGLLRIMQPSLGPPEHGLTPAEWATLNGLYRRREARIASAQELPFWVNGELARAGSCYGNLPLVVLSAGVQDQEEDPKLDHDHDRKLRLHERLAHLSAAGTHVIVASSGHDIPDEAPEAVVAAIRDLLTPIQTPQHHR